MKPSVLLLLKGACQRGMFSHVMIYEKVAVCQRVGLISVVLRLRPKRLATLRVLGDSLEKFLYTFCAMTSGPLLRLHLMQRDHAVPRLLEQCRDIDISLPLAQSHTGCKTTIANPLRV